MHYQKLKDLDERSKLEDLYPPEFKLKNWT